MDEAVEGEEGRPLGPKLAQPSKGRALDDDCEKDGQHKKYGVKERTWRQGPAKASTSDSVG